jgi:hypothetical protein
MRKLLFPLTAFAIVFASAARADDPDPKKIVEKAIAAHGGAEALAKHKDKSESASGKMKIHMMGVIEATLESVVSDKKFKHVLQFSIMGMDFNEIVCYDGKEFWIALNGKVEMTTSGKELDSLKEAIHAEEMASLIPLIDKSVELSIIGESKLGEQELIGVRASKKDHKDVNLHFDKKTGLLVKSESRNMDFLTREEVAEEREMYDYKKIDGMLVPMRIVINRDGKKYVEIDITDVKFNDKLDDSAFAKP